MNFIVGEIATLHSTYINKSDAVLDLLLPSKSNFTVFSSLRVSTKK